MLRCHRRAPHRRKAHRPVLHRAVPLTGYLHLHRQAGGRLPGSALYGSPQWGRVLGSRSVIDDDPAATGARYSGVACLNQPAARQSSARLSRCREYRQSARLPTPPTDPTAVVPQSPGSLHWRRNAGDRNRSPARVALPRLQAGWLRFPGYPRQIRWWGCQG